MRIPVVQGVIDRRILINFRIAPDRLSGLLPAPFRPQLVRGHAIGGICLIRLRQQRPRGWPAALGLSSENAAHRIAVTWDGDGAPHTGVYVPRRDSSSRFNALVGGRFFPGFQHLSQFTVDERFGEYTVAYSNRDGTRASITASRTDTVPGNSVFGNLAAASHFFLAGSGGYSPGYRSDRLEGLELRTAAWELEPLAVRQVVSSWFDDRQRFPAGSIEFDSAFLMRNVPQEWRSIAPLDCAATPSSLSGTCNEPR